MPKVPFLSVERLDVIPPPPRQVDERETPYFLRTSPALCPQHVCAQQFSNQTLTTATRPTPLCVCTNAGRQQRAAVFAMLFASQCAAVAAAAVGLTGHAARAFVIPPSAGALFSGSSSVGGAASASASAGYGKASSRSPRCCLRMDASAGNLDRSPLVCRGRSWCV